MHHMIQQTKEITKKDLSNVSYIMTLLAMGVPFHHDMHINDAYLFKIL